MPDKEKIYPSDQLIESYLQGSLSAAKRVLLEQRMAEDPEVAKKVALLRKVEQTLRFARKERLKEQFLAHFDDREKTESFESPVPAVFNAKPSFIRLAFVAVLVLVCSAVAFYIGEKMGREQSSPAPIIIRDTILVDRDSSAQKLKNFDKGNQQEKDPAQKINRPTDNAPALIARMQRRPDKDNTRGANKNPSTDTIVIIGRLWRDEKYNEVVRLARAYRLSHQLNAVTNELYADSEFMLGNFDFAESAYLELTKVTTIRKKAKWNLILCYANQWPEKKEAFEELAKEIDGWDKPNPFQKDLIRLRNLLINK